MEFFACSLRTWSDRLHLARLVFSVVRRFRMDLLPSSALRFWGAGSASGISLTGLPWSRGLYGDLIGDSAGI